ncbi:MAG: hypothetical protein FWC80_07305 [Firmicutes bacterium]|nr:hypothetical protein [Bacillota bacterium]
MADNIEKIKTVELTSVPYPGSGSKTAPKPIELVEKTVTKELVDTSYSENGFSKFVSVLKGVFVNNWQLKLTAIVTAAAVWAVTIFI